MNTFTRLTLCVAILSLTACASTMTTPQSGFLSSYDELRQQATQSLKQRRTASAIDPARIEIVELQWRAKPDADLTDEEQAGLLVKLRSELTTQFGKLPANPDGRPVIVRAAITRLETVSPALNAVSTVLLFVPLDRGGLAVEIEALDEQSHKQMAAMTMGYYAPVAEFQAQFKKLAPAEWALAQAARDFSPMLLSTMP